MKTQSNWWRELSKACWAKVNSDTDDHPRIPTPDQVVTDLGAEYMAMARNDYKAHFERAAILVYPQLDGELGEQISNEEHPQQAGVEELPAASRIEEVVENADLDGVNAIWRAAREISSELLIHPIAPLISAWQSRTEPEPRKTGIYPSSFSVARTSVFPLWADIDVQAGETPTNNLIPTTAYLPGLQPPEPQLMAYPALRRYDPSSGQLKAYRRTRGNSPAPMHERLFLEMILSVKREDRAKSIHHEVTVRDLRNWLYPNGWAKGRNWPSIYESLRELPLAGFELGERIFFPIQGIVWLPRGVPKLNAKVVLAMSFPEQSANGPLMFRPATQALGLKSDSLWRTFVQLQAQWAVGAYPAHRKKGGQKIPAGYVRADSKARVRYRVFEVDELVRMWYGAELPAVMNPNTMRSWRQRARESFETLERLGLCQIEKDAVDRDGRKGWRIMPPAGWGANFDINMREALRQITAGRTN